MSAKATKAKHTGKLNGRRAGVADSLTGTPVKTANASDRVDQMRPVVAAADKTSVAMRSGYGGLWSSLFRNVIDGVVDLLAERLAFGGCYAVFDLHLHDHLGGHF